MKKLLAILLMMPVIAFSQTNAKETVKQIEAICVNVSGLNEIVKEFDEYPFVRGLSNREHGTTQIYNSIVVFVNAEKKTWTIAEKTADGYYCLLAVGLEFQPVPFEIIDELQKQRQKSKS